MDTKMSNNGATISPMWPMFRKECHGNLCPIQCTHASPYKKFRRSISTTLRNILMEVYSLCEVYLWYRTWWSMERHLSTHLNSLSGNLHSEKSFRHIDYNWNCAKQSGQSSYFFSSWSYSKRLCHFGPFAVWRECSDCFPLLWWIPAQCYGIYKIIL